MLRVKIFLYQFCILINADCIRGTFTEPCRFQFFEFANGALTYNNKFLPIVSVFKVFKRKNR